MRSSADLNLISRTLTLLTIFMVAPTTLSPRLVIAHFMVFPSPASLAIALLTPRTSAILSTWTSAILATKSSHITSSALNTPATPPQHPHNTPSTLPSLPSLHLAYSIAAKPNFTLVLLCFDMSTPFPTSSTITHINTFNPTPRS